VVCPPAVEAGPRERRGGLPRDEEEEGWRWRVS